MQSTHLAQQQRTSFMWGAGSSAGRPLAPCRTADVLNELTRQMASNKAAHLVHVGRGQLVGQLAGPLKHLALVVGAVCKRGEWAGSQSMLGQQGTCCVSATVTRVGRAFVAASSAPTRDRRAAGRGSSRVASSHKTAQTDSEKTQQRTRDLVEGLLNGRTKPKHTQGSQAAHP